MTTRHRHLDTPLGTMVLAVDADDALVGAWFEGQQHFPDADTLGVRDDTAAQDAATQLTEWFDGRRTAFDLRLAPRGTEFQQRVWQELRRIEPGTTATYGELAQRLGMAPGASRAVGAATGRNPLLVIVPCHRLVGASGALTGFAAGVERKRWLLDHEAALRSEQPHLV